MPDTVQQVQLTWHGPCRFADAGEWSEECTPPKRPGVYMWVVGWPIAPVVTYVGQSSDLRQRTRDHVVQTLGGGYPLYDPELLSRGRHHTAYRPASGNCNRGFLRDIERHQRLAAANLRAYEVYWAELDAPKRVRESVEAGLIMALRELAEYTGTGIHENQPSLNHEYAPAVAVASVLPSHLDLPLFPVGFSFGQLAE